MAHPPRSTVASLLTLPCRIQKSMLLDLNKEIMNELGVTVVGDIIAILKHAKVVHRQVGALCHLCSWVWEGQGSGIADRRLRSKGRQTWDPRLVLHLLCDIGHIA